MVIMHSFWNAASAIATVLAAITALFLGLRRPRKQLDCALLWDFTTNAQPKLMICNPSSRLIVLKEIKIDYSGKKILEIKLTESLSVKAPSSIQPNSHVVIPEIDISELRKGKIDDPKKMNKQRKMRITIHDINSKKYVSKQKLSEEELLFMIIGKTMLSNNS